jgi:hypothetical protein
MRDLSGVAPDPELQEFFARNVGELKALLRDRREREAAGEPVEDLRQYRPLQYRHKETSIRQRLEKASNDEERSRIYAEWEQWNKRRIIRSFRLLARLEGVLPVAPARLAGCLWTPHLAPRGRSREARRQATTRRGPPRQGSDDDPDPEHVALPAGVSR